MKYSLPILFSVFILGNVIAQKAAFVLGHVDTLYSNTLAEKRVLNIFLPSGYSPDSAHTYPVIYLLDGAADEDFIHIAGLVQFASFSWVEHLPPSILVGIANTDRKRDFTYTSATGFKFPPELAAFQSAYKNAGGSARFMDFVEKELQPYIDQTYKTNAERTLIGQSLAGLMATEFLLKKPQLFNKYIIMSPSLWWDNESLLQIQPAQPKPGTKVYIAVGKEGKMMENDARNLAKLLQKSQKFPNLLFEFLPEENHGTILHPAVARAFKFFNQKK
ncbi:alpha/beta hydrolase [Haliscomenobacter sp.]|uniref:alpha/beta hydrolase n=1 Tax=Haliscomenobacter sp. TaxID=2717303 RepID=UPI003BAD8CA2